MMPPYVRHFCGFAVAFVWISIVIYYCIVVWRSRREPAISSRNPWLLIISGVGNMIIAATLWLAFVTNQYNCIWLIICCYSINSFIHIIFMLRGIQYLVLIDDKYRQRFPQLKSNKAVIRIFFYFFAFHHSMMIIFMCLSKGYKNGTCTMTWDLAYFALLVPALLILTIYISCQIPWQYDAFGIAMELKSCFLCWASFGLLSLMFGIGQWFFGLEILGSFALISILLLLVGTFAITTLRPIHSSKAILSKPTRQKSGKLLVQTSHKSKHLHKAYGLRPYGSRYFSINKVAEKYQRPKRILVHSAVSFEISERSPRANLCQMSSNVFKEATFNGYSNLEEVFNDESARQAAFEFGRVHFVSEVILFLDAVHQYRLSFNSSSLSLHKKYEEYSGIISKHIATGSNYEVNISSALRKEIMKFYRDEQGFFSLSHRDKAEIFDSISQELSKLFWANYVANFSK